MQLSHTPQAISVRFDDPNLVSASGLVPAMRLAQAADLQGLADEHLSVPTDKGAHAGLKLSSLVAGMAAGADSIDDLDMLRHGATGRLFTGIKAPSTLGTFLRGFTFGHVRQLDAVASRALLGWVEQARLLPGLDQGAVIDIDDTVKAVYGPGKQGAQFGYTKIRGLNAQLATISTAQAAPVIAATRLRRGAAHSATGAVRMLRDTIATARRAGACGPILVRADSAYCRSKVVRAVQAAGAHFSVGMPLNSAVLRAIDTIEEVGPGGHFFGTQHTQDRFRHAFYKPLVSDWRNYESWQEAGSPQAPDKARLLVQRFLDAYEAPVMDPAIREELDAFVARRVAEGGVATDY